VGLSLVLRINPIPAKKKIAPTIPNATISFMLVVPVPPFINAKAAYKIPPTPSKDKIIPRIRFSMLVFLQGKAKVRPKKINYNIPFHFPDLKISIPGEQGIEPNTHYLLERRPLTKSSTTIERKGKTKP
jgi:hypothetical protein